MRAKNHRRVKNADDSQFDTFRLFMNQFTYKLSGTNIIKIIKIKSKIFKKAKMNLKLERPTPIPTFFVGYFDSLIPNLLVVRTFGLVLLFLNAQKLRVHQALKLTAHKFLLE